MTTGRVRVVGLHVHPVKSMAGRAVPSAEVLLRGLVDDRSWMLVDGSGTMVTARTLHALVGVQADTPVTDPSLTRALRLAAPGFEELHVDLPGGTEVPVDVFGNALTGVPAAPSAQEWVHQVLGRGDLTLLWCPRPEERVLDPRYTRPGDHTAYADGYPLTVVSQESLTQLNDWIVEGALDRGEEPPAPLGMERFRPNIVVQGAGPFAEDDWTRIRVGEVTMRLVKPSPRCVLTTVDPATYETGREPIRTLARHRRVDGKVMFAVNAVPDRPGRVAVGDPVVVEG